MSCNFVWTPDLIDKLVTGRWVNPSDFRAPKVVTSRKRRVEKALFIGYTDATFRRYMGDTNYVRFAPESRVFGNIHSAQYAAEQGWVAAMIVDVELDVPVPQLVVEDSFATLEVLARYKRSLVTAPVIAVTGTVGKTSTLKALEAALGGQVGRVSSRNVRQSLAQGMANANIENGPDYYLAEVSVSALWGDDGGISHVLCPDVSLITEIGLGMTHRVPTVRDTAVVKANLINGMPKGSVLLYNSDMKWADYVKHRGEQQPVRVRSFGFDQNADYQIADTGPADGPNDTLHQTGEVVCQSVATTLSIPAFGKAHLYANCAALAVADAFGEELEAVTQRAANYQPSNTSEQIVRVFDSNLQVDHHIVDGTFSATPLSMRNAFDLAATIHSQAQDDQGELIGVLSRIVALGDQGEETHRSFAEPLISAGFDRIYTYGPDMRELAETLAAKNKHAGHFDSSARLVRSLTKDLRTGSTILLKGSKRASGFRAARDQLQKYFDIDAVATSVIVEGNVQGVGYRKWARKEAVRLGLVGWVRNYENRVKMHVQGPRKAVREFLGACGQGPEAAGVANVDVQEAPIKRHKRFRQWKTVPSG